MNHNYVKDENFNILTINRVKDVYNLTGESKEPIKVNDTINYFASEKCILGITEIVERRDSKDYPKGNGMFYRIKCVAVPRDN